MVSGPSRGEVTVKWEELHSGDFHTKAIHKVSAVIIFIYN
jgi:hypothetical protein